MLLSINQEYFVATGALGYRAAVSIQQSPMKENNIVLSAKHTEPHSIPREIQTKSIRVVLMGLNVMAAVTLL